MANWKTLLETALKGAKTAAPHILTGAKVAAPYVKSAVKTGAHAVKGTAEFVAKHPKTSLVAGAVSLPQPVRERLFWDVSHRAEPLSRLHLSPSKGISFFILKF